MCGASSVPRATARSARSSPSLFCDLVGFTARAEQIDPEDVRGAPRARTTTASARSSSGAAARSRSSSATRSWRSSGRPTAHEDDPERAVRAALAIRDFAVEEGLELRVGITTGEALVSLGASPSEGEGMASGDVVNTAAGCRAQRPSTASSSTRRRTARRATRSTTARRLRSRRRARPSPIPVWEAVAARSRFGVGRRPTTARAELVGRERELGIAPRCLRRVRGTSGRRSS